MALRPGRWRVGSSGRQVAWQTSSRLSQRSAVGETLAHLEFLYEMGRLKMERREGEDGLVIWSKA